MPDESVSNVQESSAALWNDDTIADGLVEDRRKTDRRTDRRRDYRRYADKDLITKAQQEAINIKEKARQEGFEQGVHQAQQEIQNFKNQIQELLVDRNDALSSVVDDIAPLAVAVAERIIKTEISCDDELVTYLVRDTLKKVNRKTKTVLIKVHAYDVSTIKKYIKANPIEGLDAEFLVMEDPDVEQGSCILETDSGLIDASLGTRLEILRKMFGQLKPQKDDDSEDLDWLTDDATGLENE